MNQIQRLFAVLGACMVMAAHAADAPKPLATVNGVKLGTELLDVLVSNALAQGATDSVDLRNRLRNELIAREVLAQEARKQGLDKEPAIKAQMALQQNAFLSEVLVAKQSEKIKPSDEKLRAEYKRQADSLVDAEEYQISHIVTHTEADAKAVIKAAKEGAAFDKLAAEKSIHPSAKGGGNLGWLLMSQINPSLSNVVANMAVGGITALPIQTQEGWQVLRLDAKRKYKIPTFDESKQQVINAVMANERTEYVQKLVKAAKVE
jgi:peptidyl-prolyl cis-trans isomerase C